jgi:F420-0:gamma-glutamyl ligase-like protein
MPTIVWILIWVAVIGTIAVLAFREIRSGRKQPPEFDRHKHAAVREAGVNLDVRGPNGQSQTWG